MEKQDNRYCMNEDHIQTNFYCSNCDSYIDKNKFEKNLNVCWNCGYHFKIDSNKRLELIFDEDSIKYIDSELTCENIIEFPGYSQKLCKNIKELKMNSAVITGIGEIYNNPVYFAIMDYRFIMGSMGSTEGEKLTRMIEKATDAKLPIIIYAASGGARIQEGMLAVYQMVKVAAAIKKHSKEGLLFISVLTDPTLGGVNASFASVGDIVLAEPNTTVGFAGKRVIMQTIDQELPNQFQTSEFMLEHGFIDGIVDRKSQKDTLAYLLKFHEFDYESIEFGDINIEDDGYKNLKKISISNKVTPWKRVQIARYSKRPRFNDYINGMISDFKELHGDRLFKDDKAMVCGLGYLYDLPLTIISTAKGREIYENINRNFGMAHPEGYRKVLRLVKQAEKFNRPILCLIDTPGAFCGVTAEARGQAEAIATCLMEMSDIRVPVVTVVHGEGGSGGALAISTGDYTYMLENSIYSVISPEGAAAILLKDANKASEITNHLKLTSSDLLEFGIIDEIIMEPHGGAHNDIEAIIKKLKKSIYLKIQELIKIDKEELIQNRYTKIRTKVQEVKN